MRGNFPMLLQIKIYIWRPKDDWRLVYNEVRRTGEEKMMSITMYLKEAERSYTKPWSHFLARDSNYLPLK